MINIYNYSSLFGMTEMEKAAKVIVDKINKYNNTEIGIELRDFKDDMEQIGFLHLLQYQWLDRKDYNGVFKVNKNFIERINERAKYSKKIQVEIY